MNINEIIETIADSNNPTYESHKLQLSDFVKRINEISSTKGARDNPRLMIEYYHIKSRLNFRIVADPTLPGYSETTSPDETRRGRKARSAMAMKEYLLEQIELV